MLLRSKLYPLLLFVVFSSSCAYYNTFYNAEQYFEEAEKLRLEKDGEMIPISAMDKYGKTIEKSKKVIEDFPESKYVNEALLLMGKARYYRSDYDLAINNPDTLTAWITKHPELLNNLKKEIISD